MSLLIHRCTCTHPDYFHTARERDANGNVVQVYRACGNSGCACTQAELDPEPEVVPNRKLGAATADVLPLTKPGNVVNKGTQSPWETCGCETCKAAYRDATGSR